MQIEKYRPTFQYLETMTWIPREEKAHAIIKPRVNKPIEKEGVETVFFFRYKGIFFQFR